ncbi:MAG: hypothetical protein IJE79_05810 [Alphaproteobacteria bacterium]|nr:hypothetical protein [Alphaproteobacteria bacterium]
MKFGCFSVIFAVLFVLPSVAGAVTCGGTTCATAGTWVSVGNGIQLRSLGYCVTVNETSYCAASAARCMTGYFAETNQTCEAVTGQAGYAPRCPSGSGASCFGLSCTKCSTYTGNSSATSVAGTAENSCGCYLSNSPSSTQYAGTNGNFKYTSKCYYTDATDCATTRSALIEVENPGQTTGCTVSGGTISPDNPVS